VGGEGDGLEPIYILQGLFEAAANAGVVYTFADVKFLISRRVRVQARSSSKLKPTTIGGTALTP